jgi:hypothetical protein
LRIEQPSDLRPLYVELLRRSTRLGIRQVIGFGLLPSVLMTAVLAMQAATGEHVSPWRWFVGLATGPLCLALFKPSIMLLSGGDRFAEFLDGRVRLHPIGYSFRPGDLVLGEVVPYGDFPGVYWLLLGFRPSPSARPLYWSMLVEAPDQAEGFIRELRGHAA